MSEEELLELLAGVTENLWGAVLCGNPNTEQRNLYERMSNPQKGDWVLEMSARSTPVYKRIGKLFDHYASFDYIITDLQGVNRKWTNCQFITIVTRRDI